MAELSDEIVPSDMLEGFVQEAVEASESLGRLAGQREVILIAGAVAGTLGGFVAGYFWAKRRLDREYSAYYSDLAMKEIAEFKKRVMRTKGSPVVPEKPDLQDFVKSLGYTPQGEEIELVPAIPQNIADAVRENARLRDEEPQDGERVMTPEEHIQNVFETPEPENPGGEIWDYALEVRNRQKDVPYVIHADEFRADEHGYTQTTYTYYEGDDVLADVDDTIVDDQDLVVGLENLGKFGHGSGDPNIVFVRNHELRLEAEIVHSDGKYAKEVHGFTDDELTHSATRRRRVRYDDE